MHTLPVEGEDPHYNVSVRLNDTSSGSNQTAVYEGRVEVQYHELWGTICNNQWTINNAHVVCRSVKTWRKSVTGYHFSLVGS